MVKVDPAIKVTCTPRNAFNQITLRKPFNTEVWIEEMGGQINIDFVEYLPFNNKVHSPAIFMRNVYFLFYFQ
jgi:hypothetical protein